MEQLFLSTTTLDDIIGGDGWVILMCILPAQFGWLDFPAIL